MTKKTAKSKIASTPKKKAPAVKKDAGVSALKPKGTHVKHFSEDERKRIVHAIGSVYATGKWTLESCCNAQGISERTFHNWLAKSAELSDAIEEYKRSMVEIRKQDLKKLAETGLQKLLTERTVQKKTTVVKIDASGTPMPAEVRTTEEVYMPNTAAVLFTLTNTDPASWRHTQHHEAKFAGVVAKKDVEKMSDEELDAELARLQSAMGFTPHNTGAETVEEANENTQDVEE